MGNDLEEVAANFARGTVFAFDCEARHGQARFGQDDLLDFLRLLDIESHLALAADREQQAAQQ